MYLYKGRYRVVHTSPIVFVQRAVAIVRVHVHASRFLYTLVRPVSGHPMVAARFLPRVLHGHVDAFVNELRRGHVRALLRHRFFSGVPNGVKDVSLVFGCHVHEGHGSLVRVAIFSYRGGHRSLYSAHQVVFLIALLFVWGNTNVSFRRGNAFKLHFCPIQPMLVYARERQWRRWGHTCNGGGYYCANMFFCFRGTPRFLVFLCLWCRCFRGHSVFVYQASRVYV